jgi:hypothetical protein
MRVKLAANPTRRRDIIICAVALVVLGVIFREQLAFLIRDGAYLIAHDSAYDEYIIAADKVHPIALKILKTCNETGACPEKPDGWAHQADSLKSVFGKTTYLRTRRIYTGGHVGVQPFDAFEITYDYSPDWQLYVTGGVDEDLNMVRRRR